MLTEEQSHQAAELLVEAERTRQRMPQLSMLHPEITLDEAYRIQSSYVRQRLDGGARIVGHKIGLTSRAMQIAAGIAEPDYGCILDDRLFRDGSQLSAAMFLAPKIEVELAFVMGEDLTGPGCAVHDVLRATEFVMPALEIIDFRTEPPLVVTDTIADNAAFGALVTGGRIVRPHEADLRWIGATLSRNGVIEESGLSAAIMGHPAAGIAWLANKLAAHGVTLRRGEIVLCGSFTRAVDVVAGDVFHADFGRLGAIGVSFA